MNKEYQKRIEYAQKADEIFFNSIKKSDNILERLEKDNEINELYLKAFDVAGQSTEEEKDFYFKYSEHFEYKAYVIVASGELAKMAGNKKTFTTRELKPMYDALTSVIDDAIQQNDKYQQDYIKYKKDIINEYNETLQKYGFTVKNDGCYIATAVYGSYDCPQVWLLRRYRDEIMNNHVWGRLFIHIYYSVSPFLVKWFGNKKCIICLWRRFLDVIVNKLMRKGYKNTPYTDFTP